MRGPSQPRAWPAAVALEFSDDGALLKRVEVRRREFRQLLASLKATFPQQLEAHHVVDVVKIG